MSYVLGLDLGTSGLKGVVFDQSGKVVISATEEYKLYQPAPGYSEQRPRDWIQAAKNLINHLISAHPMLQKELKGISFSGQMHSLVVLDKDKNIVRNAILWNDVRTSRECKELNEKLGQKLIDITKNKALEGFTLPKILWMKKNEPTLWDEVDCIMLPKDYLRFWFTGQVHTDYSDAAGTLLFDVNQNKWSEEICTECGIDIGLLPKLANSSQKVGVMLENIKSYFGFNHEIAVFTGGADNACAAIGAGIINEGIAMSSIGTSGVFLAYEDKSHSDYNGKLHLFNHCLDNHYYAMGVTLSAGSSLSWFRSIINKDLSYDDLLKNIDAINIGSDGLLFTPYLFGERTPYTDSLIRGSFIGLSATHTQDHLARAVLEGITFSLKDSQLMMEELSKKKFTAIISVGGGAKNNDWLQMQADIFNTKVLTLKTEEGPSAGAAMLAAIGLKWFETLEALVDTFVDYGDERIPKPENVKQYELAYKIYRDVYKATNQISHRLTKYVSNTMSK